MRINNNISALNTYRQYTANTTSANKSMEKLSSGLRINRAGDDAAGLAISEKMRAQIRGIKMSSKNSQDAISLVQTAEGALTETHAILQRMRELSVQSSSDTNEDIDRGALQAEFEQLQAEVDDISSQTAFNNMSLLDGKFAAVKRDAASTVASTGVNFTGAAAGTYTFSYTAMTADATGIVTDATVSFAANATEEAAGAYSFDYTAETLAVNTATTGYGDITTALGGESKLTTGTLTEGTYTFSYVAATDTLTMSDGTATDTAVLGTDTTITLGGITLDLTGLGDAEGTAIGGNALSVGVDQAASVAVTKGGKTVASTYNLAENTLSFGDVTMDLGVAGTLADTEGKTLTVMAPSATVTNQAGGVESATIKNGKATFTDSKISINDASVSNLNAKTLVLDEGTSMTIQTGANESETLAISIEDMTTTALSIGSDVKVDSIEAAEAAITTVDDAIKLVSNQRASMGAIQNRLEHKINNLDTSAENLQAAESRIRDVDMAKEMTEFTKNNILLQASQAMLAQANAQPQGVLQLLQ